ncbi:MAG: FkbM family methyltransferase [Lachnospiraceae bacterium]|nr:FkbM family methyltransferase [Lachnospiraceae bacterium]
MIFRFPFNKVTPHSRIIVYGAGKVGQDYSLQLKFVELYDVIAFCDKHWEEKNSFEYKVIDPKKILTMDYDYIVIALQKEETANSVMKTLLEWGIDREKIIWDNDEVYIDSDSQFKADYIVMQVLQILGISDISYMEVGANHPAAANNTYLFYKKGFRGIAIDANIKFENLWKEYRPEDLFLNVGVGECSGEMEFYICDGDALSTFDKNIADKIEAGQNHKIIQTRKVPVVPLDEIVKKYAAGVYPTYLSVDVEGFEYKVLKNSSMIGNVVCVVEINKSDMEKMNALLKEKGYFPYCRTIADIIYVREEYKKILFTKICNDNDD